MARKYNRILLQAYNDMQTMFMSNEADYKKAVSPLISAQARLGTDLSPGRPNLQVGFDLVVYSRS